MLKQVNHITEAVYVLKHLRNEDKEELSALYGKNWYNKTLKILGNKEYLVLYGKNLTGYVVPVAIGGVQTISEKSPKIGSIWMLSTLYVNNNKTSFLKSLKEQISLAKQEYDIIYNYIYIKNVKMKTLLKKLGFNFDNPRPSGIKLKSGFEFFYYVKRKEKNNVCS